MKGLIEQQLARQINPKGPLKLSWFNFVREYTNAEDTSEPWKLYQGLPVQQVEKEKGKSPFTFLREFGHLIINP